MDNRTKQRLIGVAVLIALAIIFLPELLKEPEEAVEPAARIDIPPRPQGNVNDEGMTLSLPPTADPAPAIPPPIDELTPEDLATLRNEGDQTAEPESALAPGSEGETVGSPATSQPSAAARGNAASAFPDSSSEPTTSLNTTADMPNSSPTASASAASPGASTPNISPATPPVPRPPLADVPEATTPPDQLVHIAPTPNSPPSQQPAREPAASAVDLPGVDLIGRSRGGPTAAAPLQTTGIGANWMVQAGSFSQEQNANELRDKLLIQGFDAFVEPSNMAGRTLYRVRIGPQASRTEGESTVARLRALGFEGQIISLSN